MHLQYRCTTNAENKFYNVKRFIKERVIPLKSIKDKFILTTVFLISFAISIFIFSCSESTSPESGQGQLKMTMVDAPSGYDQVNIVVTRVEVHKSGADENSGWVVINNNLATYDLIKLRNGASVVLGDNSLDVGHYTQIRLILGSGSNVVVNGIVFSLNVPSRTETGIKLNHEFDIQPGLLYELMLDFDAEHSIVYTGSEQYKLKPVIRVVPVVISGTISGKVTPVITQASVYAISGTDTVIAAAEITTGIFKLMALLHGSYNLKVVPADPLYSDTTIVNVVVVAKQNTDLGTINLHLK